MRATVSGTGVDGEEFSATNIWSNHNVVEQMISFAVINMLKNLDIAGGNLYVKRALAGTEATTLDQLAGEIKIAEDYGRYLADRDVIDALIRLNPDSAFAAGWLITLLRAEELGLTEMGGTDFIGGVASFLKGFGLDRYGADFSDVSFELDGTTMRIVIDQGEGNEPRIIDIEDFVEVTGLNHLLPAGDGQPVTGTAGDDLWFADNENGAVFTDQPGGLGITSNDVLIGGAGSDTIAAGIGMDFIQGGAGDDLIDAGTGGDIIIGGAGDDVIEGGAGDDIYVYGRGDGADVISDTAGAIDAGSDIVRFGDGITADDIEMRVIGSDLIIGLRDRDQPDQAFEDLGDRLTLTNWVDGYERIESIAFADGTLLQTSDILHRLEEFGDLATTSGDNLDGTQWIHDVYAAGTSPWQRRTRIIGDEGMTFQFGTYNDGRAFEVSYVNRVLASFAIIDAADTAAWSSITTGYSGTPSQIAYRRGVNDDGTAWQSDYDIANEFDYAEVTTLYDVSGAAISATGNNDDNSTFTTSFDLAGDQDWYSMTDVFDTAGGQIAQSGVNDDTTTWDDTYVDGQVTSSVQSDPNDVADWETITTSYDDQGRQDNQSGTRDDGSTWYTDWDQAGAAAWAQTTSNYSADGQLTSRTQVYDNGLVWDYTYVGGVLSEATATDGAEFDNYYWSQLTNTYDAAGQLTSQNGTNDDTTTWQHDYIDGVRRSTVQSDPGDVVAGWDVITTNYDDQDRLDNETVVNDDGTSSYTDWDQAGAAAWARTTSNYNAAGQLTTRTQVYDNGLVWDYTFVGGVLSEATATDADGAYAWSQLTNTYDAAGQLTSQNGTNNDTTTWQDEYIDGVRRSTVQSDPGDVVAGWDVITSNYDVQGLLDNESVINDDGTTSYTDWDQADAVDWDRTTSNYNAAGQLTSRTQVYDNGLVWDYTYVGGVLSEATATDADGAYAWSQLTNIYNAAGQLASQTGSIDDGNTWSAVWDVDDEFDWSDQQTIYNANGVAFWQTGTNDDGSTWSNAYAAPVALDLDGDGLQPISRFASTAMFDMDGDGTRDATAWVAPGDGLLAIDVGGDGVIDQTREIVFTEWSPGSTSDMAALRAIFDSNENGALDTGDARWAEFRIWSDLNQDGVSQAGEVMSLDALGINAIGLDPEGSGVTLADGTTIHGVSTYSRTDGTSGIAGDMTFAYAADGTALSDAESFAVASTQLISAMAGFGAIDGIGSLAPEQEGTAAQVSLVGPAHLQHGSGTL